MIYLNEQVNKKLKKFNKNNIHVVADFDQTITAPGSASSWSIFSMSGILGKEFFAEVDELVKFYHPLEIDETLNFREKFALMNEWWHKEFSLFIKYKLTEKQLNEVLDKVPVFFREGAKEFLKEMHENKIPVIIISGGIGNVIEKILERNSCNYDNIYLLSNIIEFENGIASKLKGKMIHVLNKNEQALPPKISEQTAARPNVLLLGDMIGDANMTSAPPENVIKAGFLDNKVQENMPYFQQAFDVVCTDNTSFTELFEKAEIFKVRNPGNKIKNPKKCNCLLTNHINMV